MKTREPKRVLFVFGWLVVGGEETEARLLAKHLDRSRYRIEVTACQRKPNMPEQAQAQLEDLHVPIDRTPYGLSFDETVNYLARKVAGYDVLVACQAPPEIYSALGKVERHPPLIEHGGLVSEALGGPKQFTSRYVGVSASIREAAAKLMPDRPEHAIQIPSMVDLSEFSRSHRAEVRLEWRAGAETPVIGWVGRLDRKKRVEDFIEAAALVHDVRGDARFMVIGGPDAFMPEYADELRLLAEQLGLRDVVTFLGDRSDVPRLMSGLDALVWLSRGEGMPHVIAEAGAACLPVVATRDNGSEEQIVDGVTGLFVPPKCPPAVAARLQQLLEDPGLRARLGRNLRQKVEREYSAEVLSRRWEALFDEVIADEVGNDKPRSTKAATGADVLQSWPPTYLEGA